MQKVIYIYVYIFKIIPCIPPTHYVPHFSTRQLVLFIFFRSKWEQDPAERQPSRKNRKIKKWIMKNIKCIYLESQVYSLFTTSFCLYITVGYVHPRGNVYSHALFPALSPFRQNALSFFLMAHINTVVSLLARLYLLLYSIDFC